MLWQRLRNGGPRWQQTDNLIDNWLKERQQLLKLYFAMTKLSTIQGTDHAPIIEIFDLQQVQELLNTLIDYVAVLHMEILEKIYALEVDIWKSYQIRYGLNPRLMEQLFKTINPILDIEAHCRRMLKKDPLPWHTLKESLSQLGNLLSIRLELEDALIGAYQVARHATQERENTS